ncbi:MAG: Ig-like domain-containing protein, partial [Deltaproteobacteria bacterium]|nr:Ig-like domain-containing protein [Deltaproteobacteria bacterium]
MRHAYLPFVLLAAACGSEVPDDTSTTEQAVWSNGDFESDVIGTMPPSGWSLSTNLNTGISDTRPNPQTLASLNLQGGGSQMSFVVGGAPESQQDPDVRANGTLRFPKYGNRAARVNYNNSSANGSGRNANTLQQTMTVGLGDVDPTDDKVHVRFAIAPVLQNPGHSYIEQPYYFVRLQNLTRGTTLYQDFNASGQPGVPWKDFTDTSGQAAQYTDWQLVDIAPGNAALAVGDQVELRIVAAGCSQSGHWGRVYVDAVGSGIPGLFTWATGVQQANAGSDITYTINYKNGGTTATSGSSLAFVTPPSTTFQSFSGASCTAPNAGATGTVTCSLGTLAPGAVGSFAVTVRINAGTANGTQITNGNYAISASGVSALIGPKVYTNVTNNVQYSDLSITKTDGIAAIEWGAPTRYTIVVRNAGPVATTATVTDTMPAKLTNVVWTCAATGGGTCPAAGSGNISNAVSLPVGATLTYTVDASIIAGTGTSSVVNTATVTATGSSTDPDSTNNTAVDTNTIGELFTLAVSKLGTAAAGAISSTPSAIDCGASCTSSSARFLDGSQVILTASPIPGASFLGWSGACSGTQTTCTVTMTGAKNVFARFVGAPASVVVANGSPQTAAVSTAFGAPLQVAVFDSAGTAVAGTTVAFAAPGSGARATPSAASAVTDSNGLAQVSATANATPGAYTVTGTVAGVASPASFSLANLGPPAAIAVVSGSPQSATVGAAFGANLVAVVRDAANQPVAGATVTFTAPGSGARASFGSPTATTNASGLASVSATAGTVAGGYSATASVAGVASPASFSLNNLAGPAAALVVVSGSGQTAPVTTAFAAPLVIRARDAHGNSVAGVGVSFSAPEGGASASLSPSSATTDASGLAQASATAGTAAGSYSVSAFADGLSVVSFTLANAPGAVTQLSIVDGAGQSATVATAFAAPLRVLARDAQGNAVPEATVAFVAALSPASATLGGASAVTDENGIAAMTASANTVAGSHHVTASHGAANVSLPLSNRAGAPASITAAAAASPQVQTVLGAYAHALAVTVRDAFANPVPDATVTWSAPGSGASAGLLPASASTDATGNAAVAATANTVAGTYIVHATVPGAASSAAFALTNVADEPATLVVEGGHPQSAQVDTDFAAQLATRLVDAYGNPISGVAVSFHAPASGATGAAAASSVATGEDGIARVSVRAGTVTGAYAIVASVPDAVSPVSFALTNTPGPAASIAAAATSTPQNSRVDETFVQPLVATVRDAFGNTVPGVVVTYAAPAAQDAGGNTVPTGALASATAVTGEDGRTGVAIIAGTRAGAYEVTASAPGVEQPARYALANLPGDAHVVSAQSGGGQLAVVSKPYTAELVAIVRDIHGNPVPGVAVDFSAPASGATASASPASTHTAADGTARTALVAGTVAGLFSVTATSPTGAAPASFPLSARPGPAATATALVTSSPQSAQVTHAFAQPLAVRVADAFGNAVPGARVDFRASEQPGARLSAAFAVSGADGIASVLASADKVAGAHTVSAQVTDIEGAGATFALANTPAGPRAVVIGTGMAQTTLATTAFAAPVTARVVDAFGNAVPGAPVRFTIASMNGAGATMSDAMPVSDAHGEVSISLTAGPVVGRFTLTAAADGATGAAIAQLEVMAIPTTLTASADTETAIDGRVDVAIKVTASLGTPAGTVELVDATGAVLGTGTLANGTAVVRLPALALGTHTVVARYAAQGSYGASASETVTFAIIEDSRSISGGGCSTGGSGAGGWL